MAFGLLGLMAIGAQLWGRSSDIILWWSLLYWLTVGLIVGARYVDIRFYKGQTVDFAPANLGHWRRYTALLIPVALVLWGGAVWAG